MVHYLSCSLPFTRYPLFNFLNTYVAMLEKNCNFFFFCFSPQLETKFKDHANTTMRERDEPFRCVVKFSSTNLLESFRHCASMGMNTELFRKIFMHNLNSTTVETMDVFLMTTRWRTSH